MPGGLIISLTMSEYTFFAVTFYQQVAFSLPGVDGKKKHSVRLQGRFEWFIHFMWRKKNTFLLLVYVVIHIYFRKIERLEAWEAE